MPTEAERFWDERAREDALFFVDNRFDYGERDLERFWQGGEEAVTRILDAVDLTIRPGDTVVDIGCGVGRVTRALARRAGRVIGIDVSSEMLAQARQHNRRLANVEWIHGDGHTLAPLDDASVDGCFSHVVFQHIPDPDVTLGYVREMARVLRPGGWAVFVVSTDPRVHRLSRSSRLRASLRAVLRLGPRGQAAPSWLGSAIDLARLREAATGVGLTVERIVAPGTQFTTLLCRSGRVPA